MQTDTEHTNATGGATHTRSGAHSDEHRMFFFAERKHSAFIGCIET